MTKPTAGQLIHALSSTDDKLAKLNGDIRTLKLERDAIVEQLEALMDEQGTTMLAADGLVCERKEDEVPQLSDWTALARFVLRHKRLDLFQRRISAPAWRELLADMKEVPGITPYTVRKLSVRKKGKPE
jgi:hypothetical protein